MKLRALVIALNLALAAGCVVAFWPSATPARVQADHIQAGRPTSAESWSPPEWHPAAADTLMVLDQLDGVGAARGPRVQAPSVIIADLDSGEILFSRDADTPRSIASVTKLFSALALAAAPDADLDREVCIGREHWPAMAGARSKFETGSCHSGWEYLGAALVASDNRGAMALPGVAGLDHDRFVALMEDTAGSIGATAVHFADPAGLLDENTASARDVLHAVVAVSLHPELAAVASAPSWRIETAHGPRELGSTNRLVGRHQTIAAKTGYTDTAHYCFATVVRTESGRRLAVVVLGAPNSNARFADAEALLRWAEDPSYVAPPVARASARKPSKRAPAKKAPSKKTSAGKKPGGKAKR